MIPVFILPAKIVQTERNTKGKLVFLCFSEVQPTFSRSERVVQTERKTKFFPVKRLVVSHICYTFVSEITRTGGASAIQTRLIAFGLHRPRSHKSQI
jgi:hypothetical protein